jgi:hypothetical protein
MGGELFPQHPDGDIAVQPDVLRLAHLAHTAAGDEGGDLVGPTLLPGDELIIYRPFMGMNSPSSMTRPCTR